MANPSEYAGKPKSPKTRSTVGPSAATGPSQALENPPPAVQAVIDEFNTIKKALSTPDPPWILAQGLNDKLKILFPPPNACLAES